MSATVSNGNGRITYEGNTLGVLAGQAAAECYGLAGIANQGVGAGLTNFFRGANAAKGVQVHEDGSNVISVKLYVTAKYGVSLPAVAENVIDKVKYTLENETGLTVENVEIVVQSIDV